MRMAPAMIGFAAIGWAGTAAADASPARSYEQACGACHIGSGYGVQRLTARLGKDKSILTTRTDLQRPYIRLVVRRGFQSMPAMSKVEVSDAELDAIIERLVPTPEAR